MARKSDRERALAARLRGIDQAEDALNELGNVFQGLGAGLERMRRCKAGTPRWNALDDYTTRMNSDGIDRSSKIRMALHFARVTIEEWRAAKKAAGE